MFLQSNGGVVLVRFPLAEEQQPEGISRPAVVVQPALKALFLGARLLVNGLRALDALRGKISQLGVIGLRAALKRVDQRHVRRAKIERGNRASIIGNDERGVAVGSEIDFVAAVGIEIERGRVSEGPLVMREPVGDGLGLREGAPDGGAQVRRVESAKNSVPVGVVALPAQKQRGGFLARLSKSTVEAAAAREPPDLVRDVQHFLVEQVRFGILA